MPTTTVRRRGTAALLAVAVALAPAATGCDWLKGSGGGTRVSPFISSLRIEPASVLCERPLEISFDYDDPQEDISLLRVSLQHTSRSNRIDQSRLWDDGSDLDLQTGRRAVYTFSFSCSDPGGRWLVEVEVDDLRDHTSNTLRGEVSLASATR